MNHINLIKAKKGDKTSFTEIKMYDEITYPILDSLNISDKIESYEQILNISPPYSCINPDSEQKIKSLLQQQMISTSGPSNLVKNFNKFYNLKESDTIDTILNNMFKLYNIYMTLYQFVLTVVKYKDLGIDIYDLRYNAVKNINNYHHVKETSLGLNSIKGNCFTH